MKTKSLLIKLLLESEQHEYGCLMAKFKRIENAETNKWLDEQFGPKDNHHEDVVEVEDEPHVTVLYGIHPAVTTNEIKEFCSNVDPVTIQLGKISKFRNGETNGTDVLKTDVISDSLKSVNKQLIDFLGTDRYTNDYPDYHPHSTLAYVKPDTFENLVGDDRFDGQEYTVTEFVYSVPGTDEKVVMPLKQSVTN